MKRRLFLKGLLGASAVAPVVVKAVTSEPLRSDSVLNTEILDEVDFSPLPNEWLEALTDNLGIKQDGILAPKGTKDIWRDAFRPGTEEWFGKNK